MVDPSGNGELGRGECHAPRDAPAAVPDEGRPRRRRRWRSVPPVRREDWQERLWHVLKQAERAAFAFGVHDCATLAADCLDAMTDSNYRARLGELYKSEREALRIMAQHGQLEALVTEALQLRPVPRNLARRG